MADIETRVDLDRLMAHFYAKLLADERTSPKFTHLNLEDHLPRIASFWEGVLLSEGNYTGNPFVKHLKLDLEAHHFAIWLDYFDTAIDELFEGPVAETAKARAHVIAQLFQHKLGLLK